MKDFSLPALLLSSQRSCEFQRSAASTVDAFIPGALVTLAGFGPAFADWLHPRPQVTVSEGSRAEELERSKGAASELVIQSLSVGRVISGVSGCEGG